MSSKSIKHTPHYAGDTQHVNSYYAATANNSPTRARLQESIETDVCIVGAGFSGLSTALHLLEKGRTVTLLEGAQVGWGASGRNGGQLVHGLNAGLDTIEKRYGKENANFIGSQVTKGANIIRRFVADYDIQCDLKELNIFAALTQKHMKALELKQALWQKHGMHDLQLLDKSAMQQHVNSPLYTGGLLDTSGGHIHPLNLALGEAAAVEKLGGTIYEKSRVIAVDNLAKQPIVTTDEGQVRCKTLVLCGNAYLGNAVPALASRVMPVSTQIIATEPLSDELAASLLPTDACVEDIRYILDYYRLSADKRLLFGGGTVYGGTDPADIEGKLKKNMLKVFPQLVGTKIDYAWSGNFALSFSRLPQLGKLADNTYHAMGYSGHGVTGTHLFGSLLADAICGDTQQFDQFAKLPWLPFPGGQRFRVQYSTMGSWWYGMRDAIGV